MPEIEFRGYSGDCLIHGRLVVPSEVRLTDFLNNSEVYPVQAVALHALNDGRPVPAGDQELGPQDIWAVEPTDTGVTPWRADLHVSTHPVQIEIDLPPYHVVGFVHGLKTADPMASVKRGRKMIPLTDAAIKFTYVGREITRESSVLIVNRDHAASIRRIADEEQAGEPELPPADPGASDHEGDLAQGETSPDRSEVIDTEGLTAAR